MFNIVNVKFWSQEARNWKETEMKIEEINPQIRKFKLTLTGDQLLELLESSNGSDACSTETWQALTDMLNKEGIGTYDD